MFAISNYIEKVDRVGCVVSRLITIYDRKEKKINKLTVKMAFTTDMPAESLTNLLITADSHSIQYVIKSPYQTRLNRE